MKQEYKNMMEQLALSPSAQSAIEEGIKETSAKRKPSHGAWRRFATAAACLVLVAACIAVPVMAASTDIFDEFLAKMIEDIELEIEEVKNLGSNIVAVKDEDGHTGTMSVAGPADFLEESDGRLYFTANGEHIDITDKISYEEPFIYIYTDEEQIIHYIAVGGVYNPDPTRIDHGWLEYFQNAPGTEPFDSHSEDGWIGGHGHNHINVDTETEYPWSVKAMIEFDTPWTEFVLERAE